MLPSFFRRLWAAPWGPAALPRDAYAMLCVATIAQFVTVVITWPLWQARTSPPNLPVVDLPQMPFGIAIVLSLAAVLWQPRLGVALHAVLLLVASLWDQNRTQPQFAANLLLMVACLAPQGAALTRWFLAGMWFWAGLHKFLSPDWFAHHSWNQTVSLGLDPADYYLTYASCVAVSEMSLGIAAIVAPRKAAYGCAALHVGIVVFLSPLFAEWNYSVLPWNLATTIIGFWILSRCESVLPTSRWETAFAAASLLLPAGFYVGWIDHGYASVLYSDNLPKGFVTTAEGTHEIEGWGDLCVPFPSERRLFVQHFARSPQIHAGAKMHLHDPRLWLDDAYFVKRSPGEVTEITAEQFFRGGETELVGIGLDCRRCIFFLGRAGAKMLRRTPESAIYAVEIPPDSYRPEHLTHFAGLPNLEQIQLENCPVTDRHLATLPHLPRLGGIGLNGTQVTDAGMFHLRKFPQLQTVQSEGTGVTTEFEPRSK